MRILLCLLASLCFTLAAGASELVDLLTKERQQDLYYDTDRLPQTVKDIVQRGCTIQALQAAFVESDDALVQFNLVLIADKLVAKPLQDERFKADAKEFLLSCLKHPNPWVRTEAIWSLGGHYQVDRKAFDELFGDKSDFVLLEAVDAYTKTQRQPLTDPGIVQRYQAATRALVDRKAAADAEMKAYAKSLEHDRPH